MIILNLRKLPLYSKRILAFAVAATLCLSSSGCSVIGDILKYGNSQQSGKNDSLLSEIPAPKQSSYSYSAITNEHIKNLYAQIEKESEKLSPEEIQCTAVLSEKDIYEAIVAFKNDRPDVFWLGNTFSYYEFDGATYVEIEYIVTGSQLEKHQSRFSTALNDFAENAPMYSSEYEREKYVNDYIVSVCEYDENAAKKDYDLCNASTAYGVLVDGKAVCEGYARAFQLLCNKMGIECVSVAGMTDDVGHEWNCAYIDGSWYQVDVTWNDADDEVEKYYYFNLTDSQMYSSHDADDLFSDIDEETYNTDSVLIGNLFVPQCNSTEYNYYQQTAPTLYGFDEENDNTITAALESSALNGDKYFSIIIDSSLDYDDAYSELVDEGYVINYIESANNALWGKTELSTSSYAYPNDELRIITIELNYIY